jgi:hypothetical protein
MTFYKRAKALYDANYEDDRVTIVQSLVLMGWYWEGPEGGSSFLLELPEGDTDNAVRRNEERILLESGSYNCCPRLGHAQKVILPGVLQRCDFR